jgi:hypothetical protein
VALFAAPAAVGKTGASYDAEAHTLSAEGAAAADLRAPSAAIARVKAERQARAQAERKIVAALVELGHGGGDLDALNKEVADAKVADERYGSDGSVALTLVLGVDKVDKADKVDKVDKADKKHPRKRKRAE